MVMEGGNWTSRPDHEQKRAFLENVIANRTLSVVFMRFAISNFFLDKQAD